MRKFISYTALVLFVGILAGCAGTKSSPGIAIPGMGPSAYAGKYFVGYVDGKWYSSKYGIHDMSVHDCKRAREWSESGGLFNLPDEYVDNRPDLSFDQCVDGTKFVDVTDKGLLIVMVGSPWVLSKGVNLSKNDIVLFTSPKMRTNYGSSLVSVVCKSGDKECARKTKIGVYDQNGQSGDDAIDIRTGFLTMKDGKPVDTSGMKPAWVLPKNWREGLPKPNPVRAKELEEKLQSLSWDVTFH